MAKQKMFFTNASKAGGKTPGVMTLNVDTLQRMITNAVQQAVQPLQEQVDALTAQLHVNAVEWAPYEGVTEATMEESASMVHEHLPIVTNIIDDSGDWGPYEEAPMPDASGNYN